MARVETTKIIMNIPVDLLKQLDDYAIKMNINRTSAVCVLLSTALAGQRAMTDLSEFLELYKAGLIKNKGQE